MTDSWAALSRLSRGFPLRHLRHAKWLVRNYIHPVPDQWFDKSNPSIVHSRIAPSATYSPWLSDEQFMEVYNRVKQYTLVDIYRCYELWTFARNTAEIEGCILEVGVWRGGSGAILAAASPMKTVYLADTFSGVVKAGEHDTRYRGGEHADSSRAIVENLFRAMNLANSEILEGVFPEETAGGIHGPISLLHCDVDVYDSTKDVVRWALPRLAHGGTMIFDDYGFSGCEGVTKFVNELRTHSKLLFVHNLNGHAIFVKF
jgi:O-methyltransferase